MPTIAKLIVEVDANDTEACRMARHFGDHYTNKPGLSLYKVTPVRAKKLKLLIQEGFRLAESFHPKVALFYYKDAKTAKFQLSQAVSMAKVIQQIRSERVLIPASKG